MEEFWCCFMGTSCGKRPKRKANPELLLKGVKGKSTQIPEKSSGESEYYAAPEKAIYIVQQAVLQMTRKLRSSQRRTSQSCSDCTRGAIPTSRCRQHPPTLSKLFSARGKSAQPITLSHYFRPRPIRAEGNTYY